MITVERLNTRAEGVASGQPFARVLPGEVVELDGDKTRIVTPSPHRVAAPCRHYKSCGGCALQHASDDFVAGWKQDSVRRALAAQGVEAPMRPIVTSPAQTRRRATLTGRRLKTGALVGFHGRASDTIVPVPDCLLIDPALAAKLPALAEFVGVGGSRKAELRLTLTLFAQGVELAVTGGKPLDPALRVALPALAARHRLARLAWDDEVLYQPEPPRVSFGRAAVSPPPGAFLQATPQGEAALQQAMREAVGPARRVADLFAGCGTFALPLAENAEVHAVEGSAPMLAALDRAWRETPGLKRVTTEARDLFRRPLLPTDLASFDALVIDPPRAGAEAQVAEIVRAQVPVVAMVSCNPVTFARDAQALIAGGFLLDWVQVVDQFRWSSHIELAARFSRLHPSRP